MNTLDEDLHIRQKGHENYTTIKASERVKVYNFDNKEKDPFIQITDGLTSSFH
jgi:hypothetical protein